MSENFIAIRFVHPQFDSEEASVGFKTDINKALQTVSNSQSIRQAVLLLLSTRPGERVMRPEYGCHLHRLLFSPNDATTAGLAMHYVRRAIDLWEPRIHILSLDAGQDKTNSSCLLVTLDYRVVSSREEHRIMVSMNLMGQEY